MVVSRFKAENGLLKWRNAMHARLVGCVVLSVAVVAVAGCGGGGGGSSSPLTPVLDATNAGAYLGTFSGGDSGGFIGIIDQYGTLAVTGYGQDGPFTVNGAVNASMNVTGTGHSIAYPSVTVQVTGTFAVSGGVGRISGSWSDSEGNCGTYSVAQEQAPAQGPGSYSGTISGDASGTLSGSMASSGTMSVTANVSGVLISMTGGVSADGVVLMVGTSQGATILVRGSMAGSGTSASGSWYSTDGDTGTWSIHKT